MIPKQIFNQIPDRCAEGLVLAVANESDGAVMVLQWCNKAFSKMTGYTFAEAVGQRGTILIGQDTEKSKHLRIIEKLMNWEQFSLTVLNNRKNGELYWQNMSWVPLSDGDTGKRWWLCSLVELHDRPVESVKRVAAAESDLAVAGFAGQADRIRTLEKENARLL